MSTDFLPNEGSLFDDMKPKTPLPTEEQLNSLALRMELNQRTGASISVATQEQRQDMRKVLSYWQKQGELHHPVDVFVDPGVEPGKVRVGYR